MRMRYLSILLPMLVGFGAAPSVAQPAACLTKTDDGGLQVGRNASVTSEKKEFYESSKAYPVRTFSDRAATGKTAEFCLRYEIENVGQDHIQNLYWGLAGISVKDFRPGAHDRQSRSQQLQSFKDPEIDRTVLNAFTNNKAESQVWRVETQTAKATASPFAEVVAVDREQFLPGAVLQVLAANSIAQRGLLKVVNIEEGKPIYPIRQTVSGEGIDLEVNSRVVLDGSSVSFQTDVSLGGESAGNARIAMPALLALADTKAAGAPEYYDAYLSSVETQRSEFIGDFKQQRFSTTLDRRALLHNSLFLSEHVITVRANDNEYCYRFQSYLPFAVNYDLDRCAQ
ncbi:MULTISPECIES: hypothetical protein [Rhizobium]|uniref:Uncharacterized protein n=1 Tax=Rhizobium tropici TaxID=398 RepID=A0A329YMB3_RHITR|nr:MULTISPECIES: hypothetical protein [Rhizobium]MBX4913673.1 hypothetical protein [Rhizobium bangladeshense]RAX42515.1 hypothetical protein DQ393_06785 [Rhizobium tropici]